MRDGSITPRRRRGGAIVEADDTYRCEVVTPILQYEDITDLQEVIRALVKKGAMANSSCGIHVHVDGANHTPESLCRLLNFATGRQDLSTKPCRSAAAQTTGATKSTLPCSVK